MRTLHLIYSLNKLLVTLLILASVNAGARPVSLVKITGDDENNVADVIQLGDGTKALRTSGLVTIEEIFGKDPQGTTWSFIGTASDANGVGAAGDIVTTTIKAAVVPLDLIYPAVSVGTIVTTSMVSDSNPERALATQICADLKADSNFSTAQWNCIVMKDFSGVFINSKLFNEFGERKGCSPLTDCFNMTATGSTVITVAFNEIESRGLPTELARSPNNPRQGVLAISGSITIQPSGFSNRFFEFAKSGGSQEMSVDGSVTPVVFTIENTTPGFQAFIISIKCWVSDNGIKFGQYGGINSPLTNGFVLFVESEGITNTLESLRTTDDFKHFFATNGGFRLDVQAGRDDFEAELSLIIPFILNPTEISTDKITFTVNDNLTSLLTQQCTARGFLREI